MNWAVMFGALFYFSVVASVVVALKALVEGRWWRYPAAVGAAVCLAAFFGWLAARL
jgi:hypothetical protein